MEKKKKMTFFIIHKKGTKRRTRGREFSKSMKILNTDSLSNKYKIMACVLSVIEPNLHLSLITKWQNIICTNVYKSGTQDGSFRKTEANKKSERLSTHTQNESFPISLLLWTPVMFKKHHGHQSWYESAKLSAGYYHCLKYFIQLKEPTFSKRDPNT